MADKNKIDVDFAGAAFVAGVFLLILFFWGGGVLDAVFDIDDGFIIGAHVTLNSGSAAPRKEAGIRLNSPVSGDALFLVNSDAGDIVAFGGGAPFFIFSSNGTGNGYTPGDTIFMQMVYEASEGGANGVPATVIYNIDRGAGLETSCPLVVGEP
jgi:hypothetical protein